MKTDWQTCWGSTSSLGFVGWRYQTTMHEETWGSSNWSENRGRHCIDLFCVSHEPISDGLNHSTVAKKTTFTLFLSTTKKGRGQECSSTCASWCRSVALIRCSSDFPRRPARLWSWTLTPLHRTRLNPSLTRTEQQTWEQKLHRNWKSNHSHRFSLLMSTANNYSSVCTLFTSVTFRDKLWIKHFLTNICSNL